MLQLSFDKIYPLSTLSVDGNYVQEKDKQVEHHRPFLFLEKKGIITDYVYVGHVDSAQSMDTLRNESIPIDRVSILEIDQPISASTIFQALGQPIALVKNEEEYLGYIRREDLLIELFQKDNETTNHLKVMLSSIPMGIFVVDHELKCTNCNETGLKMIKSTYDQVMGANLGNIFNKEHMEKVYLTSEAILNQIHITNDFGIIVDYSPIINSLGIVDGVMIIVQDLPKVEKMAMEIESIKNLNDDLNAILTSMYDEIIVVNNKGEILRHSDRFISDFWGTHLQDLVGKSILDLEEKGIFTPSVTRLVLEKRERVSIIQETKNGKVVMAVGNPIFNEENELHRIVIASRDITETTQLKSELQETKRLTEEYKEELDQLKNKNSFAKKIIYRSPQMERIMLQIKKIAQFSSTVMIMGESGVGKELVARAIHTYSQRSNAPFLAINCGAIPEELLESELFGYVKGAFTGADHEGKVGYFQKANQGILFLDEISELSQRLQVKLLRVLQEKEITPVGSTTSLPVDVQVITATNKDLQQMVQDGEFREDLFYRLHVIPITIPPLRERPEDISLLAFHFIKQLNEQYEKNHHLSPDAIRLLEAYSWPGNIRELQNFIERLVVFADEDVITADFIHSFMSFTSTKQVEPIITEVIPFKEAQQLLEEQLISLAMDRYRTTTRAAEALQIDQSTVSRKYKKILQRRSGEKSPSMQ